MKRAPYPGQLKLGSTGPTVVLLKRALREAGLLPAVGKPTGFLGPYAVQALVKLGRASTLPALVRPGVTRPGARRVVPFQNGGIYGPRSHVKLANYYDDYGASRLRAIERARQIGQVQAAGIAACNLVIDNRGVIHYTQGPLRMSGVRGHLMPPRFGHWEDCSSERTWVAWVQDQVARLFGGRYPDPNGRDYDGEGFTGTLVTTGSIVPAASGPIAFTSVFFGPPPSFTHVAVKRAMDRLMSMGSEAGPLDEPLFYRPVAEARLNLPVLPA